MKLGHGKRVNGSSVRMCFACGRPKGDTTAAPSRAELTGSAHCVPGCWAHGLSFNTGSSIK